MRLLKTALFCLPLFVALSYLGVYLGDLVGIGGYDGWASEALYWKYQLGDVRLWIYRATELAALTALSAGPIGAVVSFGVVAVLLAMWFYNFIRNVR